MKRTLIWLFPLLFSALLLSSSSRQGAEEERFFHLDVFVDPYGVPLAAWQVHVEDETGRAVLVGIEGGEHAAFVEPAYHDPAALQGERVILAALSVDSDLPRERTRVARLHWSVRGDVEPDFRIELQAAADPSGAQIHPKVEVQR